MLKIGLDIDGVLANFAEAYQRETVAVAGVDLFEPGDAENPPVWDWPEHRGYDAGTMVEVWSRIKASPDFWLNLRPLQGMHEFNDLSLALHEAGAHVYFVTARAGAPKHQTEMWMMGHAYGIPTVLMSREKGAIAKALGLDAFIDDDLKNAVAIAQHSPATLSYLLNRRYNETSFAPGIIRVNSVAEFLDAELARVHRSAGEIVPQ